MFLYFSSIESLYLNPKLHGHSVGRGKSALKKVLLVGRPMEHGSRGGASWLRILSLSPHPSVLPVFLSANKGVHLTGHPKSFLKK